MEIRTCLLLVCGIVLLGCVEETQDTATDPLPLESLFSFVVLADPHIAGPLEHEERLEQAIEWVNEHVETRDLELVLVVGDIGWSSGLERSRELLDGLSIPYVPLIGDNEVQTDDEERYHETYASQFEVLSDTLEDWYKAAAPVEYSDSGELAWLQNLSFEHKGVRFVGADTVVRGVRGSLGELGSLNDYEGGTWPFLEEVFSDAEFRPKESIVLAGHVPMMMGALDLQQMAAVETLLGPVGDWVHAHYAGHLHIDYEESIYTAGYELYVTDATWDDDITLRVVDVSGNEEEMAYSQELVRVE